MDNSNETSSAERALALLRSRGFGVLSTVSRRMPDYPFASLVTYAVDRGARPLFLLSRLAAHTTNLLAHAKASLLVFEEVAERDPLNSARVNLFGEISAVPDDEVPAARPAFLARHPESAQWIDFGDFAFYRMTLSGAYYIAGFGVMGWVGGHELVAH